MRRLAFASFLALATVTAGPALAGAPAKAPLAVTLQVSRIDADLDKLPLGQNKDAVFSWVRARMERELAPKLKACLDDSERLALRAAFERDLEALEGSVIPFDGRQTGFETSLVASEFAAGGNESLLVFREASGVHYFFFAGDRLWKYARPLTADVPFAQRVATLRADLGPVSGQSTIASATADGSVVTQATWNGLNATVRVADHRRVFRSDLLVVESPTLAREVVQARSGVGLRGSYELDPETRALLMGADEPEEIEVTEE